MDQPRPLTFEPIIHPVELPYTSERLEHATLGIRLRGDDSGAAVAAPPDAAPPDAAPPDAAAPIGAGRIAG